LGCSEHGLVVAAFVGTKQELCHWVPDAWGMWGWL
jgi:hypothetical protein